ncbi:MAG: hypothetical protein ABSG86_09865 [Thermoguttaceae bacterium]
MGLGGPLGLNLTDAQKAKVAELRKEFEAKFASILTPEQKEKVSKARQAMQNRRPEGKPAAKPPKKADVKPPKKPEVKS